jgi:glutamate 5-kinase
LFFVSRIFLRSYLIPSLPKLKSTFTSRVKRAKGESAIHTRHKEKTIAGIKKPPPHHTLFLPSSKPTSASMEQRLEAAYKPHNHINVTCSLCNTVLDDNASYCRCGYKDVPPNRQFVKGPCSHCVEKDEKVGNPCSIARCKLCHEGIRVQGREEGSWV